MPSSSEAGATTPEHDPPPAPAAGGRAPRLWEGAPSRSDKALMWSIGGLSAFVLVMWPLKPFMISSAPVLLAVATGSKAAIGAVGAFAESGRYPLWLAVAAGVLGLAKSDWLFWWAGRQWGQAALDLFARDSRARRMVFRARLSRPWVLGCLVLCGRLPGAPGALFYAAAGWAGMRLSTFLVLDLLGALAVAAALVLLGYLLGEQALDMIVLVDSYAIWVSLAIVFGLAFLPAIRRKRANPTLAESSYSPVEPSDEPS